MTKWFTIQRIYSKKYPNSSDGTHHDVTIFEVARISGMRGRNQCGNEGKWGGNVDIGVKLRHINK